MKLKDITVEVRDKNLVRLGLVRPEDMELEFVIQHNNVGSWKLTLPTEDPMAQALANLGSGIIITGPNDVLMSGPTTQPEETITPQDFSGTTVFTGVSDTVILADMLAWPQPSNNNAATQNVVADVRTGPAETLMHAYVNANVGPGAPSPRRNTHLTMGANLARGASTTKNARFTQLGVVLSELGAVANLGFRVVQRDAALIFETYAVADKSATVRLDVHNGTLAGQRTAITAPGMTRAIVAGYGEGVKQKIVAVDNATSQAAELSWARRIERFVDARSAESTAEMTQAGNEVLAAEGFTSVSVQATPAEDMAMEFGTEWYVGDQVATVYDGLELTAVATACVGKVDAAGFRIGVVLGDPTNFDPDGALGSRMSSAESRLSALERTVSPGPKVQTVVKVDQSQTRNNTTAFITDDQLAFNVIAGFTYIFTVELEVYSGNSSVCDFQCRWTHPGGTLSWSGAGLDPNSTGVDVTIGSGQFRSYLDTASPTRAIGYGLNSGADSTARVGIHLRGTYFATTSGTVNLQWAQLAAGAVPTRVCTGSWLRAERV